MDKQEMLQESSEQINKAAAWAIRVVPEKGKRGIMYAGLAVLALAAAIFIYKTFYYRAPVTGIYQSAQPANGMAGQPTHQTAPVKLQVYDKKTVSKQMGLPDESISTPKEVTATAKFGPSEGGYTAAAVTNTETGITEIIRKEDPRPLFGFGGKSEVGLLGGASTEGNAAVVYARQDVLRIGSVNLGAVAGAGSLGGKLGAGAFVDVSYRW